MGFSGMTRICQLEMKGYNVPERNKQGIHGGGEAQSKQKRWFVRGVEVEVGKLHGRIS